MSSRYVPDLRDIIEGTYSKDRYSSKLSTNIRIKVTAEAVLAGQLGTNTCAIHINASQQAMTGDGFPPEIEDIDIIGISGAYQGITPFPEMNGAATLKKSGARILFKAICHDPAGIHITTCNDTGLKKELAKTIEECGSYPLAFIDVRYTRAREGADMPTEPRRACKRRVASNALRAAATVEEAVTIARRMAPTYAEEMIPGFRQEELPPLLEEIIENVQARKPVKRDRTGEPPVRKPARQRKVPASPSGQAQQPGGQPVERRSTMKRWVSE